MGGIFFQGFVGAAAGLMSWAVAEPMFPKTTASERWGQVEMIFMVLLGGLVGVGIGAVRGYRQGSRAHLLRSAAIGLVFGAIGATFGYTFGGGLRQALFPMITFGGGESVVIRMPARILGLAPIGFFLGAAIGGGGLTFKRLWVGAIGGLIGAAIAGAIFDPVADLVGPLQLALKGGQSTDLNGLPAIQTETGGISRALFAILLGGFVGLFIGIVERITRTAWVRLVLGRNEGREWIVDAPQTFLGRSETAQIPLFGDANVAPMHACIQKQGGAYLLLDGGSPIGTGLNGQRIQTAPLFDGAQIQIGSHTLLFMMKQGSAPQKAAEALRAQAYYPAGAAPQPVGTPYAAPNPASGGFAATQAMPYVPQAAGPSMPTQAVSPVAPSMPTQAVAPAGVHSPVLVATSGPLTGQRFPVGGVVEAGRETSGISLAFDTSASRRHASFSPAPGGIQVSDLGSTNGTFVNDQRVASSTLRPGDHVRIGVTTFRVE